MKDGRGSRLPVGKGHASNVFQAMQWGLPEAWSGSEASHLIKATDHIIEVVALEGVACHIRPFVSNQFSVISAQVINV